MHLDRRRAQWALALALAAAVVTPARAQTPARGRIAGRITDSQGAVLNGALVTLAANGIKRKVEADRAGSFSFEELVTGPEFLYSLSVDGPRPAPRLPNKSGTGA
jgi:hypothetical protein